METSQRIFTANESTGFYMIDSNINVSLVAEISTLRSR